MHLRGEESVIVGGEVRVDGGEVRLRHGHGEERLRHLLELVAPREAQPQRLDEQRLQLLGRELVEDRAELAHLHRHAGHGHRGTGRAHAARSSCRECAAGMLGHRYRYPSSA